jgi:hypothetical protein
LELIGNTISQQKAAAAPLKVDTAKRVVDHIIFYL